MNGAVALPGLWDRLCLPLSERAALESTYGQAVPTVRGIAFTGGWTAWQAKYRRCRGRLPGGGYIWKRRES